MIMIPDWALGFLLGIFTALFLLIAFDFNFFNFFGKKRGAALESVRGAIIKRLAMGPVIVAVGGGTGLSTLLKGIKGFTRNITAVVAVTDEGGSSGRIKAEWGMLPPGDVRNCMVALAENDSELKKILDFRFDRGELAGHSLGNLLLLAVTELCGDFSAAVERMNHLLAIRGRVLPVTTEGISLAGKTVNGLKIRGELEISHYGHELSEIWLEPQNARPLEDVMKAVDDADIILLGPGSLFTSVIPNLLLPDFAEKLCAAPVPKVYICNLMTQPEETEGMNIVQHLDWVSAALGEVPDCIVVNSEPIPDDIIASYKEQGASPLYLDYHQREEINRRGCLCIEAPIALVFAEQHTVKHDPQKLADVIFKLCRSIDERD